MGSGVSSEKLKEAKVVIIGAGYAGIELASCLRRSGISFTIIDKKEYFHHCVGALRAAVNPEFGKRLALPLAEAYGDCFIQGEVTRLDLENNAVYLTNGDKLNFTHCVVAVGSLGPNPARSVKVKREDLFEEYQHMSEVIAKANKIVLVGGGPVGVEFAGEIRDKYKQKEITIVHKGDKLVSESFDDKFQKKLQDTLDRCNIKTVQGYVKNFKGLELNKVKEQVVTTDNEVINADLVISCIGLPPNKESIERLVPRDKIDENGRVRVNEFLQVEGLTNVFAIGDCCNTQEDKMAAHAGIHGRSVADNIYRMLTGSQLKRYKQAFTGMLVPIGKTMGVGNMNGYNMPTFAIVMLKCMDLFTGKYWGIMGLKYKENGS